MLIVFLAACPPTLVDKAVSASVPAISPQCKLILNADPLLLIELDIMKS